MKIQTITLNAERNVTLTCYFHDMSPKLGIDRRPAVIITPGGGYQYCSDREADPVAFPYLKAGYHAFILRYSVGKDAVWPNPLTDFDQAIALLRDNADEWQIIPDRIAVIGFSAGGHLAAAAATMAVNRPNAAIIGYGVVGNDVKGCNASAPDTTLFVDRNTCPCFLFSSRTDALVPVENSVQFMMALCKANIAFESHIYAFGPHGFSTCEPSVQNMHAEPHCERIPNWVADSVGWLRDVFGDLVHGEGIQPPVCRRYSNGNNDPVLSIDCTIAHLLRHPEAAAILAPIVDGIQNIADVQGGDPMALFGALPLRTALGYANLTPDQITALDTALRAHKVDG